MKREPGTKVLIIEDCREGRPATGQSGIYEGDFPRGAIVFWGDRSEEYHYDIFIEHPAVRIIPYWAPRDDVKHPLGDNHPITREKEPERPFWFESDNPRIRLPDGSVIWGDECWWGDAEGAPPLEEAQADLAEHKAVLRGIAQAIAEERADRETKE